MAKSSSDRAQLPSWIFWDRIAWVFLLVLAFTMVTRILGLDVKAFHHDESLYATYARNLYIGSEVLSAKIYDPMLHGPMNFHLPLIVLFLFGITDVTVRLTSAILGILTVASVWGMRQRIGRLEALIACLLTAASPVMMYFTRFLREDSYFNFFGGAMVYCFVRYLDTQKARFFYGATVMICSLAATKENAFVNFFICGSFLVLYALYRMAMDRSEQPFRRMTVFARYPLVVKGLIMLAILGGYFVVFGAVHYLKTEGAAAAAPDQAKMWRMYWISFLAVEALFVLACEVYRFMHRAAKTPEEGRETFASRFNQDARVFTWAALLFTLLFVVLYTSFFRVWDTFWKGLYEWFFYWANQHKVQRIKGPFHYYIPFLFLYEILPLSVACIGLLGKLVKKPAFLISCTVWLVLMILLGVSGLPKKWQSDVIHPDHIYMALTVFFLTFWGTVAYLREGAIFRSFLVYWMGWAFNIYSFFQEKVPWLAMHIAMPMILLAALYIADIARFRVRWIRTTLLSLIGVLFLYTLHGSLVLSFRNEDDPRERMVYVQSSSNAPKMAQEIRLACFRAGTKEKTRMVIQAFHGLEWPFIWYLRDYTTIEYPTSIDVARIIEDPPAVLMINRDTYLANKAVLSSFYFMNYQEMRVWWEPVWSELTKDTFEYQGVPAKTKEYWMKTPTGRKLFKLYRYVMYREVFSVVGSEDLVLCIRKDLGWGGDLPTDRQSLLKLVPQPASAVAFGQGQVKEPKGIAVAPDGRTAVVDSGGGQIHLFDDSGKVLATIGSPGSLPGQLNQPTGVVFSPEGHVVVADSWNHRIQAFGPRGDLVGILGASPTVGQDGQQVSSFFFAPKDVTYDDQGRLLVSDTGHHRVCVFSPKVFEGADPNTPINPAPKLLFAMGSPNMAPGADQASLDEPVGVAVAQGKIWVADTVNGRISMFDQASGQPQGSVPMPVDGWRGEGDRYVEPFVKVTQDGTLIVSDAKSHRLLCLNQDGTVKQSLGRQGSGMGEFNSPKGLAISSSGEVLVADQLNNRYQRVQIP